MKISQFSTFVPDGDSVIGYNTFTDHYLPLNHQLHQLIESGQANGNIDELNDYHPELYAAMIASGFLVDEQKDEVDAVRQISEAVDNAETAYLLTINPTMNCNFKCWYCYETHIKGSRMVVSVLDKIALMLQRQVGTMPDLEDYTISFFGGEPLLNYRDVVVPVLQHAYPLLTEAGIRLHVVFTTNGYLVKQDMIDELKGFVEPFFQITLDGNRETHDTIRFVNNKRGSYDQIMENVQLLLSNGVPVRLRVNYTKKTLLGITDIIDDLTVLSDAERKHLLVDFHQVWQDGEDLNDDIVAVMEYFREAGLYATAPYKFPNNVISSCYADKRNSAVINYNGDVFKCTARDFKSANREGYLNEQGEVVWENDSLERRMSAKFNNRPCLSCFMLPVCNGGCSQHAVEHKEGEDYCIYNFDEKAKQRLILDQYHYKYGHR